jgi:predicted oxidoreductase (fatty acid repression mutant protein)
MPNLNTQIQEKSQEVEEKIQEIMEKLRTPGAFNSAEEVDKYFEDSLREVVVTLLQKIAEAVKTY